MFFLSMSLRPNFVKGIKNSIQSFFGFTRAQTNGFVVLLPVLAIALFSQPIYSWWVSQQPIDFSREQKELDSIYAYWKAQQKVKADAVLMDEVSDAFFAFNPNTIQSDEMKSLGFSKGLAKGILNYRAKGGSFRIKSDLKKMYGMDSVFYEKLKPFILLPDAIEKKASTYVAFEKKKPAAFDLNSADTTALKSVYGIGSKLAARIIKYRDKLGGFIQQDQLFEVYGLDSAVVQKLMGVSFISGEFTPAKININIADEQKLSTHPYMNKKIAKAIVAYRFQHGNFTTVEDVKNVRLVDTVTFEKLKVYLSVENQPSSGN